MAHNLCCHGTFQLCTSSTDNVQTTSGQMKSTKCSSDQFSCLKKPADGVGTVQVHSPNATTVLEPQCIMMENFCDNYPDCLDHTDEPPGCNRCTKLEKACR